MDAWLPALKQSDAPASREDIEEEHTQVRDLYQTHTQASQTTQSIKAKSESQLIALCVCVSHTHSLTESLTGVVPFPE